MRGQVVLAGIGGQGVLFATKLLSTFARSTGENVIGSETHGMAQRGGSVVSHLKVGDFKSPLVRRAAADFLIAFEKTETFRTLCFLKSGGTCFINAPNCDFISDSIAGDLAARKITVRTVDADRISTEIKVPLAVNLVLLGFAVTHDSFGADAEQFLETVRENTPERFRKNNIAAFKAGMAAGIVNATGCKSK